jgi:hypothetical protein
MWWHRGDDTERQQRRTLGRSPDIRMVIVTD